MTERKELGHTGPLHGLQWPEVQSNLWEDLGGDQPQGITLGFDIVWRGQERGILVERGSLWFCLT